MIMLLDHLESSLIETLRVYWRIKAGSAALLGSADAHPLMGQILSYENIPGCKFANPIVGPECVENTFNEVSGYISSGKLSVTFFLQLISHMERFFCGKLSEKGLSTDGTLGNLQRRCESAYPIGDNHIRRMDEIRERRNVFIHHGGVVTSKYVTAANFVFSASGGVIRDPSSVTSIDISGAYLSYCVDVLIDYGKCI